MKYADFVDKKKFCSDFYEHHGDNQSELLSDGNNILFGSIHTEKLLHEPFAVLKNLGYWSILIVSLRITRA